MSTEKYNKEVELAESKDAKKINKDWTGNNKSVFVTLGSSAHTAEDRQEHDYYATDPAAVRMLLKLVEFGRFIYEPACGEGHLSKALAEAGKIVYSTDLIDRQFGKGGVNFLSDEVKYFDGDIITNPPYSHAKEFITKSLSIIPEGKKVAMFLKVQFMEGKGRKKLFLETPPKYIFVSSSRINCAKNGNFEGLRTSGGSAVAYAWYIWEKGFTGETTLKWFN
jgi:hypothetical protein